MPRKNIIQITLEVEGDQVEYLNKIAERYDLADESKALRVLLDYAIVDGDGVVQRPQSAQRRG